MKNLSAINFLIFCLLMVKDEGNEHARPGAFSNEKNRWVNHWKGGVMQAEGHSEELNKFSD